MFSYFSLTSVNDALVCLIVTLLLFVMVAQMEMASPGTYPPRSSRTLHVTGPWDRQVRPILCSISQWNGCCIIHSRRGLIINFEMVIKYIWRKKIMHPRLTAKMGGSRLRSIGFMMIKTCWFLWVNPVSSLNAALQKNCTQPCLPKNVEGSPKGKPNLKGKLWMPAESNTDSPPEMYQICTIVITSHSIQAAFNGASRGLSGRTEVFQCKHSIWKMNKYD